MVRVFAVAESAPTPTFICVGEMKGQGFAEFQKST